MHWLRYTNMLQFSPDMWFSGKLVSTLIKEWSNFWLFWYVFFVKKNPKYLMMDISSRLRKNNYLLANYICKSEKQFHSTQRITLRRCQQHRYGIILNIRPGHKLMSSLPMQRMGIFTSNHKGKTMNDAFPHQPISFTACFHRCALWS
jgi:hypothetical protein